MTVFCSHSASARSSSSACAVQFSSIPASHSISIPSQPRPIQPFHFDACVKLLWKANKSISLGQSCFLNVPLAMLPATQISAEQNQWGGAPQIKNVWSFSAFLCGFFWQIAYRQLFYGLAVRSLTWNKTYLICWLWSVAWMLFLGKCSDICIPRNIHSPLYEQVNDSEESVHLSNSTSFICATQFASVWIKDDQPDDQERTINRT